MLLVALGDLLLDVAAWASRLGAHGERTMLSDRGVAPDLEPGDLERAWFRGCEHLHLSGYSLMRAPIDAAALAAARLARAEGARVSVDLASWSDIHAMGPSRLRSRLEEIAPDVIFADEREAAALGGPLPAPTWVLKRGPRGCVVGVGDRRIELPAVGAEVVDTTGAGDALAAGFALGGSPEEAALRGLRAAAECVARMGAMPA
jgi:sugar/nucleoside kinase (ribokinase family)